VSEYTVKALGPGTWNDFADLAGRHNGVWNGCWCTWFHTFYSDKVKDRTAEDNRDAKRQRVNEGRAHAALVFDGDLAVAWCQYGTPDELPNIYHRKEYLTGQDKVPDYRLTCFFVDKKYRRKGVAAVALKGALELIAQDGGGLVEAYPQDTAEGQKVSATFLYSATRSLFEQAGFAYDRPKGKNHCVMSKLVAPAG
jgi:GNAT superfamily N-acetyltransferase